MTALEIIIASIGGAGVLVGVLGWLTKSLISHFLDKDIHEYKLKLVANNDAELSRLKHELDKLTYEHRVRFERLHVRRDEVIAELYYRIVDFYYGVEEFVDNTILFGEEVLDKEKNKLWDRVDSFKNYAEKHRIYFSKELCGKLDELYSSADEPTSLLMNKVENKDMKDIIKAWQNAKDGLTGNVTEIRREIEEEFRGLLGVNN